MHDVHVGRALDPPLTPEGEQQARALAEHLCTEHIDVAQSSPRRRTRQTAEEIVRSRDLALKTEGALDEIDNGDWGGVSFAQLAQDRSWQLWNEARDLHSAGRGESMLDVQRRIVRHLLEMQRRHAGSVVLLVTHAEVVRSALLYFLWMPVATHSRIEVSPAAIARLHLDDHGCRLVALNERAAS